MLFLIFPIFFSLQLWLVLSEMNLTPVTFILVGIGLIMFLLPPVPGLPIYLTLGIVIIPVGKKSFGDDTGGVIISICYAILVSLAIKLLATALQQKLIGGMFKRYVRVRRLVGINSNLIGAMKLLLTEKGLRLAEVSILCGGPSWPTSVLCGINCL